MLPVLAFVMVLFASAEVVRRSSPPRSQRSRKPELAVASAGPPRGPLSAALPAADPAAADKQPAAPERRADADPPRARALLQSIRTYLEADQFSCQVHEDCGVIESGFRGNNGLFVIRVAATGNPLALGVIVRIPIVVPEERRVDMAETVTRVNHGLLLGSFDFNLGERTLRFRNSMPVADGTVTQEQFRRLLYSSLATVNRYHRAFNRLVYGDDLSPAEVVAEIEMAD